MDFVSEWVRALRAFDVTITFNLWFNTWCRIIPQAVSVRYGLSIGASCAPIVEGMMYLFGKWRHRQVRSLKRMFSTLAPIAYPIAKLLDYILGRNDTHTYKKAELKWNYRCFPIILCPGNWQVVLWTRSFLAFHRQGEEPLRDDEISILNGVLELNNKHVDSIMTPMEVRPSKCWCISSNVLSSLRMSLLSVPTGFSTMTP